ncbi:ATP-binding cassette domain-containing protein [Lentilactobacillus parafarraginis]|nr:ATP-binding cassette domain-containing protein [Lentilactobacillus parafarraginis]
MFKSILGITRYAGTITINGKPVSDAKVGKLIEYPNFYQKLTVQQNLNLYAQYIGVQQTAITEVLKKVSLNNARNMPFQSLSLGMKQRLGIARALMGNKQVLLLDEPQNVLDPLGIRAVRNLLNDPEIRRNKIILLASHNLNEISRIVDKIVSSI